MPIGFGEPCIANADCTERPNGKCLKTCPICDGTNNQGCFYPQLQSAVALASTSRLEEHMDGITFGHWTKRLVGSASSRRGLLRLGLGGGLGLLGFAQIAVEVSACRRTGKPCDKRKRNGNCCSGTCRRGKCRTTPGAFGCKVGQDICEGEAVQCPDNPDGQCVMLDSGKPFCYEAAGCDGCLSNADCTTFPNGRCVTNCPACSPSTGRACAYPQI